jgi:hypothetical protein
LAYALKVRECPQILFLRGNKMVYREKGEIVVHSLHFQCVPETQFCFVLAQRHTHYRLYSHNDALLLTYLYLCRTQNCGRAGSDDCIFLLQCKEACMDR